MNVRIRKSMFRTRIYLLKLIKLEILCVADIHDSSRGIEGSIHGWTSFIEVFEYKVYTAWFFLFQI
jgi:hypothetical protein